jgi:jumonji domain-containing protein 7
MLSLNKESMERLHETVGSLWCSRSIPILDEPPSSFEFLRDHVSPSRPCIIRNAMLDETTNAPITITLDELVLNHPDVRLTVDVTPNGHGDCVRAVHLEGNCPNQRVFVRPMSQVMTLAEFRDNLRSATEPCKQQASFVATNSSNDDHCDETVSTPTSTTRPPAPPPAVYYYSRQNDCLRQELQEFCLQIPPSHVFAMQAFDTGPPDAMNVWIGNASSTSDWHRDPYENLYYVASGTKTVWLCPPADITCLPHEQFMAGTFEPNSKGEWKVRMDDHDATTVRWMAANVLEPADHIMYPLLQYAHPLCIQVHAGDMLYLPSLWFHRVTQTCETIAINYWYDMKFNDSKWIYFDFLEHLTVTSSGDDDKSKGVGG